MHVVAQPNTEKPPSFGLLMTNASSQSITVYTASHNPLSPCASAHVRTVNRKGAVTCTDPIGDAEDLLLQHLCWQPKATNHLVFHGI